MNASSMSGKDPRLDQILDIIIGLASGNLGARITPSDHGDDLEAVIIGLNMLAEEMSAAFEALYEARSELEKRVRERTVELEKANQQLQRELAERRQVEEQLQGYATELERSNQELQQFAYAASHDLQEPLRMITSYLQLLERRYQGQLDADADDFIHFAVDGAARMHELIGGLLAYSRVSTHGQPFQSTDSQTTLQQVLANLKLAIEEGGATVTYDPLPTVMADPTQLAQLFQNLIGNALKFRRDVPPEIVIHAERRGHDSREQAAHWLFSVRDNGIGIEPQYTERIFAIFQRLHTRDEYPGTGIGLALCRRIVERHGGRIWVESESGQGSTFYFTISAGR